jgi:glutathione S-transferase
MLTLHQFAASHFNEKVRWALDYKGLPHKRETYLPGPHFPVIKKLSGGPSTTPLLQHDGGYASGSAAIIDWLEDQYPEPALLPADKALRATASALQTRFDAIVGPATRTLLFEILLSEPDYLCDTFSASKPWLKRLAFRASFPVAKGFIRKGNGVFPDKIAKSRLITQSALDEVATGVASTGYLVGNHFSVADLCAASLLAPLTNIRHPDMHRIEPMPASVKEFLAQWEDHAAIAWVHQMYARHRPSNSQEGP